VIVGRPGEPVLKDIAQASARRIVVTARLAASGRLGNLPPGTALIVRAKPERPGSTVWREAKRICSSVISSPSIFALAARYEDELKIIGSAGDFEQMSFALRPEFSRLVPLIDPCVACHARCR